MNKETNNCVVTDELKHILDEIASSKSEVVDKLFKITQGNTDEFIEFIDVYNLNNDNDVKKILTDINNTVKGDHEVATAKTANKKCALVTIRSAGVAYEVAKLLAKDGFHLIIVGSNSPLLDEVKAQLTSEYKIELISIISDLTHTTAPFNIYNTVKEKGISIDVLVTEIDDEHNDFFSQRDVRRQIELVQSNISGCIGLTQLILNEMILRNEGKVLHLLSNRTKFSDEIPTFYEATVSFINTYSELMVQELKNTNVTISRVSQIVDTDFFNKSVKEVEPNHKNVARDAYEVMLRGDTQGKSGIKNELMVGMGNLRSGEAPVLTANKNVSSHSTNQ